VLAPLSGWGIDSNEASADGPILAVNLQPHPQTVAGLLHVEIAASDWGHLVIRRGVEKNRSPMIQQRAFEVVRCIPIGQWTRRPLIA
jgi:hypothetical protein